MLPEPRLTFVRNFTRLRHFQADKMAPGRRFFDTVVFKGAYQLAPNVLEPVDEVAPIVPADEYWEPSRGLATSVKRAGDLVLVKPGTDVIVTGAAHAPNGAPSERWDVSVGVAGHPPYAATVTGPRQFRRGRVRGWHLSDPDPALSVPIRYELAYGGAYPKRPEDPAELAVYEPNPSGVGFFDPDRLDPERAHPGPQWEPIGAPIRGAKDAGPLTGLGPISRAWRARRELAGTYDAAWLERTREEAERGLAPDYPPDLDPRFFQCAHPALALPRHVRGDEKLGLSGLVRNTGRPFVTRLPGTAVYAELRIGPERWVEQRLPLDTVHIDLDAERVYLTWRLSLDQARDVRGAIFTERPLSSA